MRGTDRIAGKAPALGFLVCGLAGAATADVWGDRDALLHVLAAQGNAGFLMPLESDVDRYMQADVRRALEIARDAPGDDCVRAVQVALYLDAHRLPRDAGRLAHDGGLASAPEAIWQMQDGRDVFALLRWSWDADLWKSVEGLSNAASYGAAFVSSTREAAREKRAIWEQEAVALSLSAGWDRGQLELAVARLEHQAGRAVDWIVSTEEWVRARLVSADKAFEIDMKTAEYDWQLARHRLETDLGEARLADPQDAAAVTRKLAIEEAYFLQREAAQARRADSIIEAMVVREENLAMAFQDFAQARVQQAALQHYTGAILGGRCGALERRALSD